MSTLTPGTLISQRVDNTHDDPTQRAPLVLGGKDFKGVTDAVAINAEKKANLIWLICFLTAAGFAGLFFGLIGYLFATGVGVWGNNQPIAWGFPIINFVFWVGIGHAGTLISAVLFLFRQNWRTSINRFAEAMTIFAVICAGIFPGIHVGRPWLAYWLFAPEGTDQKKLLKTVLIETDPHFLKWALHKVVVWRNEEVPENLVHIHGKSDRIFPFRFVNPDFTVDNSGHLMVMNRAEDISNLLEKLISA